MSETLDNLKTQIKTLTEIVETQNEQLKQLTALPSHVATVVAITKKGVVVEAKGGSVMEVEKPPKLDLTVGNSVLLNRANQITRITEMETGGVTSTIARVIDKKTVTIDGPEGEFVIPSNGIALAAGDTVLLSRSRVAVLKKIPAPPKFEPAIKTITWGDIGGNASAKAAMIEAVEWPTKLRSLYKKFNKSPLKGVLLYGPPGNGKTLLAKAASSALATLHGAEGKHAFFSIKGPEVLSKWVGEGEGSVRKLFATAKRHSQVNGFQSVIFVDEADSILSARGHAHHSYTDTIVNQFLVEMDGIEDSGVLVILATNRHDMLDPAILREGRVDRKVEVGRPTLSDAKEIALIHLKGIPFEGITRSEAGELIADKVYEHAKDRISGAMLAGVVDRSTTNAIHRAQTCTVNGISRSDITDAVFSV